MHEMTRRTALTATTATIAAAIPAIAVAAPDSTDPIFAAINEHKRLEHEAYRASQALEDAEEDAYEQHENRPIALITWRNYHIGGTEIETRRQALLREAAADPEQIEREYLDAKARYQAKLDAETEWDKRSGTAPLRRKRDEADAEWEAAGEKLSTVKATTTAGAAALIEYAAADLEDGERAWHFPALRAAAKALAEMPV
jgi:hypothetical protein